MRAQLLVLAAFTASIAGCGNDTQTGHRDRPLVGKYRVGWQSCRFAHFQLSDEALRAVTTDLEGLLDDWEQRDWAPGPAKRVYEEASILYDFYVTIPQQRLALLLVTGKTDDAAALVESYRNEVTLRAAHPGPPTPEQLDWSNESAMTRIESSRPAG